jgi:hypothetical protein
MNNLDNFSTDMASHCFGMLDKAEQLRIRFGKKRKETKVRGGARQEVNMSLV